MNLRRALPSGPVAHCERRRGPNARANALAIEAVSRLVDVTPGTRDWLMTALTFADPVTGELWPTSTRMRECMPSRRTGGLVGQRSPARWKSWASAAGYVISRRILPGKPTPKGERLRALGQDPGKHRTGHGTCAVTIDFARLGVKPARAPVAAAARRNVPVSARSLAETERNEPKSVFESFQTRPGRTPNAALIPSSPTVKATRAIATEPLSPALAQVAERVARLLEARTPAPARKPKGKDPPG